MTDWGPIVGGAAAIVAAGLAVVSANWTVKNRHAATKDALDIRDRLQGEQREAWEPVVQRHIEIEVGRMAGPSPLTVGFIFFLLGYIANLISLSLEGSSFDKLPGSWLLPLIGLVCTLLGVAIWVIVAWRAVRSRYHGTVAKARRGRS